MAKRRIPKAVKAQIKASREGKNYDRRNEKRSAKLMGRLRLKSTGAHPDQLKWTPAGRKLVEGIQGGSCREARLQFTQHEGAVGRVLKDSTYVVPVGGYMGWYAHKGQVYIILSPAGTHRRAYTEILDPKRGPCLIRSKHFRELRKVEDED